jgi:thiol:disulfide interchange protein
MEGIMLRPDRRLFLGILMLSLSIVVSCGERAAPEAERTAPDPAGSPAMDTPPPASEVVAEAVRTARASDKVVLIEFGASWCTWCTHFQQFVHSPEAGRVITDNFVVVTLTVREAEDKRALEHPGGSELMAEWGGAGAGLPFYVFLDAEGAKVADSNAMPDGSNIGYPVSALEIERFMALLERTGPRITPAARAIVLAYLEKAAAQS